MPASLNFFDTYMMTALLEQVTPQPCFFRDRYFKTGAGDIFAADKVLVEYMKSGQRMAAFIADRVGDIPTDRRGYEIHELQPARISHSRLLTLDDLKQRGFGEAIYANSTPAQRAAKLQQGDLAYLDNLIENREEWMAAQTMINNACTMQEYVDAKTKGGVKHVQFYEGTSDHTYTVATKWNAAGADINGDVRNMCKMLAGRGLPAVDLILGSEVEDPFEADEVIKERLNRNSGIIMGTIDPELTKYPGVAYLGTLNFSGFRLNIFVADETLTDETGASVAVFPADAVMVTAPDCGHMMYGQITQIDYGAVDFTTYAAKRVPKFSVKQDDDIRKLRLASRPLAAPKQYCPYIYAASVVA